MGKFPQDEPGRWPNARRTSRHVRPLGRRRLWRVTPIPISGRHWTTELRSSSSTPERLGSWPYTTTLTWCDPASPVSVPTPGSRPPTPEELAASLRGRTAPIKALLLDQGPISGLGNIYADEALHLARIHPLVPGGRLDIEDLQRLLEAVQQVLASAIADGGTTLDDLAYLLPDGRSGDHMTRLAVYGRTDEPCLGCGSPIARVVVRARSTHFCPACQPVR